MVRDHKLSSMNDLKWNRLQTTLNEHLTVTFGKCILLFITYTLLIETVAA